MPRKRFILLFITCLFLYLVFKNLNIQELLIAIKNFDLKYIVFLSISIIISLACRGICFKILISKTVNAPLKDLIPLCLTGAALNIILPARAGDIFRAYYVGQKYNANKVKIFGSVMLERIFDGLIILGLLLFGIVTYNKNGLAQHLCLWGAFIFIGSLIFAFIIFKYNKMDFICSFLIQIVEKFPKTISEFLIKSINFTNKTCNSFVNGFEVFQYPVKLLQVMLFSLGIWFFECLNYYIVIQGFNLDISASVVLFIIGFVAVACMIPSTSIFVGPYQVAIIAAFSIYNVSKETALAVSIVEQTIVAATVSIIAAIFLLKNNLSLKEIKNVNCNTPDGE